MYDAFIESTHCVFKQVDVAVLEVGLGGKYDATNVVCDISVIIF